MRSFRLVAPVVGVLLVAACSGGGGAGSAETADPPSTSVTTTTAPTTTVPPPLTREAAAAEYLAIVEPYNTALEALELGINGGQPIESLESLAAAVVAANDAQMQALRSTVWPVDVQPAVTELIAESEQAQPGWVRASEATTRDAVIAGVVAATEHDGGEAAGTIRTLLGLDDYDEDDYT